MQACAYPVRSGLVREPSQSVIENSQEALEDRKLTRSVAVRVVESTVCQQWGFFLRLIIKASYQNQPF